MRRSMRPLLYLSAAAVSTTSLINSSDADKESVTHSDSREACGAQEPFITLYSMLTELSHRFMSFGEQALDNQANVGDLIPMRLLLSASVASSVDAIPALQLQLHSLKRTTGALTSQGAETNPVIIAQNKPKEVQSMRRLAEAEYGGPLPPRFTDAELFRYAMTYGYLRAKTHTQKMRALREGAEAAVRTAEWLQHHTFSSKEQLEQFSHLIHWGPPDEAGRPTLHLNIGRAVHECRGPASLHFANAVISIMEVAIREGTLSDEPGQPQQISVVMDAGGGSALRASRLAWIFKAVASTLNHHYPGRLHHLVLADLPVVLTWLVAAVKKGMHAHTREKVRVMHNGVMED